MKTLQSLIFEADLKFNLWREISNDPEALEERGKTKEEAECLASYFEGKVDLLQDLLFDVGLPR